MATWYGGPICEKDLCGVSLIYNSANGSSFAEMFFLPDNLFRWTRYFPVVYLSTKVYANQSNIL